MAQSLQDQSIAWFKKVVLGFASNATILQAHGIGKVVGKPRLGRLNFFWYDPKLKKELPFYDRFPLVIPLNYYEDGFLGLNLHYLPIGPRLAFFEELAELESRKGMLDNFKLTLQRTYNLSSHLKVTYPKLRDTPRYSAYEVCIKRYLYNHVRSPFLDIQPKYWENVVTLPVSRFAKGKPY
jgi:hypothetical protein